MGMLLENVHMPAARPIPSVRLTYSNPVTTEQWEWTNDCWMTLMAKCLCQPTTRIIWHCGIYDRHLIPQWLQSWLPVTSYCQGRFVRGDGNKLRQRRV
jgi:hypothetical protein